MDISKPEQRVLHVLAQGGHLRINKNESGTPIGIDCVTRDGWYMSLCTLTLFKKLKYKRAIASHGSGPYLITRRGLELVRSQPDNR